MTTTRSKTFSFVRPSLTKQGTNCCTHSNSFQYTKEGISSFHHIRRQFSTSSSTLLYGGSKYNVGSGGGSTNNPKKSNEQNNNNEDDKAAADFEPTWTYTPYKPPPPKGKNRYKRGPGTSSNNDQQQRRNFSSRKNNDGDWIVPNKVTIPEDKIDMSFARSSGAGGQNVNKVNTQVIIKLNIMEATWIPKEVRERIKQNESNKINKEGVLVIASQEYRTQVQNRKDALDKLQEIILKNYPRPKQRKMRTGISKKAKEKNREQKKFRSEVKKNRKRVDF